MTHLLLAYFLVLGASPLTEVALPEEQNTSSSFSGLLQLIQVKPRSFSTGTKTQLDLMATSSSPAA